MNAVREFRREDTADVARLWLRVFRQGDARAAAPLQEYFGDILFESPWADPALPSLVYEEDGLGIVGFLGVIPRRMTFNQQRVKVAVATQLMVDERARSYPGVKLLRRFFAGPQDLSFSDGANEFAERLWRSCGGEAALLYSLNWNRILRPVQYAGARLRQRGGRAYALAARVLSPACQGLDALAARTAPGARWLPERTNLTIEDDPPDATLLWCIEHLGGGRALRPDYDLRYFRWLLKRAGEKRMYGALTRTVVRTPGGDIAGWYLYYLERGGVGQVLQFGARRDAVRSVLNSLFHRAREEGAIAISGELDPRYMKEIATTRCQFACPGYSVLAHSRNADILNAVHAGNAFLTRLEGEWWARFSDPEWTLKGPPPTVPVAGAAHSGLHGNGAAPAAYQSNPGRGDGHERAVA